MKQVYQVKTNFFNRPQIVGKGRKLSAKTIEEAQANLEAAANRLVTEARWAGFMSPINELRLPLLELRLLRRKVAR